MQVNELLLYPTTWKNLANTMLNNKNQASMSFTLYTTCVNPVKQSSKKGQNESILLEVRRWSL